MGNYLSSGLLCYVAYICNIFLFARRISALILYHTIMYNQQTHNFYFCTVRLYITSHAWDKTNFPTPYNTLCFDQTANPLFLPSLSLSLSCKSLPGYTRPQPAVCRL